MPTMGKAAGWCFASDFGPRAAFPPLWRAVPPDCFCVFAGREERRGAVATAGINRRPVDDRFFVDFFFT